MEKCSYIVEHLTEFCYNNPIRENVFVLNMMPLQDENQKLDWYNLKIFPEAKIFQYKDHYGNSKHFFNILKNHQNLRIISSFQATVSSPKEIPDHLSKKAWEDLKELKQSGYLWDWFQFGYFTRASSQLKEFLLKEGIKKEIDPLTSLKQLNKRLFSLFTYRPKSTNVHSSIEEILTFRQGVCQDYTHVMVTIARLWGIASRYVSGYLYQKRGDELTSAANESHAWCECYLPSLGWLGFDPANNKMVDLQHIKTAIGKDYKEVSPHNGFFKGKAKSELTVHVTIKKTKIKH